MIVVADSSPLIFLAAVSQFALLRLYFSSLLIPTAVHQEVIEAGRERPGAQETRKALEAGWIKIADPSDEQRISGRTDRCIRHSSSARVKPESGYYPFLYSIT